MTQSNAPRRANLQMACYALGSLEEFQMFHEHEITEVVMIIVQPYVGHTSEYSCSVEELREVEEFLRVSAEETRTSPRFVPSWDNCHFCRAKGHCQAQRAEVVKDALDGFEEEWVKREPTLAEQYAKLDFIRDWCGAIEQRALDTLSAGGPLPGYKLVEGRKGDRGWDDATAVENKLSAMRLKKEDTHTTKLKTPTQLEDAKILGDTQAKRIFAHVKRAPGKPTIARADDPRSALGSSLLDSDFEFDI